VTECRRCGECCRWLASKCVGFAPEVIDYLTKRGCKVDDGYVLIPHRCQHLRLDEKLSTYALEDTQPDGTDGPYKRLLVPKYKCDIHNTQEYPLICKRFHGHGAYYIPQGCVYFRSEDEQTEKDIYLKSMSRKKGQKTLVRDGKTV
jgi:hypothetical protein